MADPRLPSDDKRLVRTMRFLDLLDPVDNKWSWHKFNDAVATSAAVSTGLATVATGIADLLHVITANWEHITALIGAVGAWKFDATARKVQRVKLAKETPK